MRVYNIHIPLCMHNTIYASYRLCTLTMYTSSYIFQQLTPEQRMETNELAQRGHEEHRLLDGHAG